MAGSKKVTFRRFFLFPAILLMGALLFQNSAGGADLRIGTVSFMKLFFSHPLVKAKFNLSTLRFDTSRALEELREGCREYEKLQTLNQKLEEDFISESARLREQARKAVYADPLATGVSDSGLQEKAREAEAAYWKRRREIGAAMGALNRKGVGPVVKELLDAGDKGRPSLELFLNGNMMISVLRDLRNAVATSARAEGLQCVFNSDMIRFQGKTDQQTPEEQTWSGSNPLGEFLAAPSGSDQESELRARELLEQWIGFSDSLISGPLGEYAASVAPGSGRDITDLAIGQLAVKKQEESHD